MFSRRVWLGVNNVVARAWAGGGVAVSGNVGFGDSFFELVSPFAVTQEPFMHQHLSEPWASRLFTRNYVHARGCCILHNCLVYAYSDLEKHIPSYTGCKIAIATHRSAACVLPSKLIRYSAGCKCLHFTDLFLHRHASCRVSPSNAADNKTWYVSYQ